MEKAIKESDVIAVICEDCYADCPGTCAEVEKIKALTAVQPEPHWIPCEFRMPTRKDHVDDMVLVCYGNGSVRFNTCMDGEWVQGNPIAWMPLPTPYKPNK